MSLKIGGNGGDSSGFGMSFENGVLRVSGMDQITASGTFEQDMELRFS